jgi:uncharacterized membrane protein YeaQ/YmgE (transglycosylase-associated protein family)
MGSGRETPSGSSSAKPGTEPAWVGKRPHSRRIAKGEKIMLLLFWVVGGLAAGFVTGRVMSSEGRDWVMDLVMGVAGGIGGGFLLSATHIAVRGAMIYTSLAAIAGAALLAGVSRYLSGRREYGSTD